MLKSEAAAYLAGVTQTEGAEASAPTNLHVITGEVGEASADGKTLVKIDGLMFSESDDQFIEVDALGGLEEGDIATIVLTGEQGHAMTPLALGSIGSVDRITVRIAAIEADYIKVEQLDAATARIGELEADHVSVNDFNAATGRIGTLETTRATIADLNAATARIGTLEADHVSTDDFNAATARIGTLETDTADIGTIRANSAKVQNLTAAELEADHATVGSLSTNYAHITNGVIDNAKIGYADVNNLSAHYAEIQNGKINSALIDTAAIVDEQVFTVTGNKATLAQIDASKINVLNLKAKDIEVERINGQPVTNKTLVDALSQHESDISGLDSKIDSEVEALNDRIDGAIETFTGTVVPTLDNTPASQWNTVKLKDQHVGDVYYVVNSQSAQNGYCYRFTKSGSTYSWQLIKDSDVTAALSRLQTAEGKIGNIEQFDETVGSFMTNTEDEISSLKTKDTQLETSLGDKVSTSTFNTVSQKVDTNEANITSMSTVLTNNGLTSSTNITNTVNSVKQTADTNKASITSLTQTVNNKADGSTVTTLTNRVSTVEQNLSGITTRVGKTESAIETVSNPNLIPFFSFDLTDIYHSTNNPNGYWYANSATPTKPNATWNSCWTQLENGWSHIEESNSGSSTILYYASGNVAADTFIESGKTYTILTEMRNCIGTPAGIHASTGASDTRLPGSANQVPKYSSGSYVHYDVLTAKNATGTTPSRPFNFRIDLAAGKSFSCDVRVSLYEGEYSGPYKPYVDQTLSNRVKSAETSIEQNAEDISLRATKAEVQSLGGNLLTDTDNPVLGSNIAPKYSVVSGGNGTGTIATVTDSPLPSYTKSFRITGNTSGNRDFAQSVGIVYGQNYLFTAYVRGIGGEARALIRVFSGSELFTYSIVVGTDWTPIRIIVTLTGAGSAAYYFFQFGITGAGSIEYIAPCLSGGAAANTAAELKVANDNINLKVSKNDVINQINVSTEGVKIDANRVTIDGTAVFNAAKSKLDAAYDAKGAAATVQTNLDNSIETASGNGFYVRWDDNQGTEYAGGEARFYAYDPVTKTKGTGAGWVLWNGVKRTVPSAIVNPNSAYPYNIPIYFVLRLSSATSTTGTIYAVWYKDGWKSANPNASTSGAISDWTWVEATDIVLASCVEPASEAQFTDCQTYDPPLLCTQVTTITTTAASAQALATTANNTANNATPKANAVKRTQRIWYRKSASGAPSTPGTASSNWVTKPDDGNDAWTKMHIAINSTHKYIYTCEQYEMANGTVGYTSVLLDNTITVIDGGNIITGSVTANKLNAANINASKTLTVGAMTDAAASTILNSNMVVGGRNLLLVTGTPQSKTMPATAAGSYTTWDPYKLVGAYNTLGLSAGDSITISFDWSVTGAAANSTIKIGTNVDPWEYFGVLVTFAAGASSGHVKKTYTVSSKLASCAGTTLRARIDAVGTAITTSMALTLSNMKLEKGNKATDWTPAPEDQTAYVNEATYQSSQPNLSPFFSFALDNYYNASASPDGYWDNSKASYGENLSDGWAHLSKNNTGSSTTWLTIYEHSVWRHAHGDLKGSTKYTVMIEFRNVTKSGNVTCIGTTTHASSWPSMFVGNSDKGNVAVSDGVQYHIGTTVADPSSATGCTTRTLITVPAGASIDCDMRVSLYEGEYSGPYKPYSGDVLFTTYASLAGTNESLEGAIADIGELSDQLVDTTTEQNKTITTIQTYLNSLRQDLDAEIESRQKWLNFDTAEGLIIGAKNSTFKTVTTNTSQQFKNGGTVLAETSGMEFVAPVMRSDQILIGNWMWTRRDNGNLSLKWIG